MVRKHGFDPKVGTVSEVQAECLREAGVPATAVHGRPRDLVPPAVEAGERLIWSVAADYDRSPKSHAIVIDGCDAEGVHFMDPSGGLYRRMTWERFDICSRGSGVRTSAPDPTLTGTLRSVDLLPPLPVPVPHVAGSGAVAAIFAATVFGQSVPALRNWFLLIAVVLANAFYLSVAWLDRHPRLRLRAGEGWLEIDRLAGSRRISVAGVARAVLAMAGVPGDRSLRLVLIGADEQPLVTLPVAPTAARPLVAVLPAAGLAGEGLHSPPVASEAALNQTRSQQSL